ncbi:hypothetical protein BT93_L1364 [Corymbia citriodora subsp. variegata]|uniref:Uncharacterized protein n=1 Tax=Corymbia citriodora subsp. variegata TaxID=360336 RepID=A0A8T0CED9_CORYI|nr:hypothetical protein BT93_L1364 [Corymbia citriodora subsp. variegata]
MSTLKFTLSAEATGRVHDFLLCLAKFGEQVCLEARNDQLTFTTLNSSRTAYASFGLDPKAFFISYTFGSFNTAAGSHSIGSVIGLQEPLFRSPSGRRLDRTMRSQRGRPAGQGVTKTYRLTYESTEISHALFDKTTAPNGWTISSRILREYIEYFGTKTENLDLLAKDGKAIFTSFTEKVMDGKGKTTKRSCEG